MKSILLIGGGGHCRSVIDTINKTGIYDQIGIIDDSRDECSGIPIVGSDEDVYRLHDLGWTDAFITVGSTGDTAVRRSLYDMVKKVGFEIPVIIDPSAIVSDDVVIGKGTFVAKGAIINTGCMIGECVIINTGAIIEHDCRIGSFAHVSPGATLCGQTEIGDDTHVGAGSVIRQLIRVGHDSLIGAGSVVVKDIPDVVKAYGNPCKVVDKTVMLR